MQHKAWNEQCRPKGRGPDLCAACPGSDRTRLCLCRLVAGSAVAICVGGALVSGADPSGASPALADGPPPHGNCLTPTHIWIGVFVRIWSLISVLTS